MNRLRQDPSLSVLLLCVGGIGLGFVALLLGWIGASRQLFATLQLPWLVSGGLTGLALIGLSVTLLGVHLRRRGVAHELLLLDEATALAHRLTHDRAAR